MVRCSRSPSRARARSITSRTSLTVADTAESCSKARLVVAATTWAKVVLPVPGGPQKMAEDRRSASTSARNGRPGPTRCSCPTISSRVRGRRRAASGDCRRRRSSTAALNRSSDPRSAAERRVAIARTVPSRSPERSFPSGRDGDYGSALRVDRARDPNPNHDGNEDVHECTHLEGHHRRWPGGGQRGRGRHSSRRPGRDHRGHERGRSGRPSDRERVRRAHQRRGHRSPRRKPRSQRPAAASRRSTPTSACSPWRARTAGSSPPCEADASVDGVARNRPIGEAPGRAQCHAQDVEKLTAEERASATGRRHGSGPGGRRAAGRQAVGHEDDRRHPDGSYAVNQGNHGVLVGIIDTGIDASHPDLAPNFNASLSRNFTTDIPLIDGDCALEPTSPATTRPTSTRTATAPTSPARWRPPSTASGRRRRRARRARW